MNNAKAFAKAKELIFLRELHLEIRLRKQLQALLEEPFLLKEIIKFASAVAKTDFVLLCLDLQLYDRVAKLT